MSDFYANTAQVLAIVVLALVWESGYFDRLGTKSYDRARFWNLKRVRIYSVTAATVVIADVALCLAVLAGVFTNSPALRVIVGAGLALALGTLLFRMVAHVMGWDNQPPPSP